jgi:hypothetical protein
MHVHLEVSWYRIHLSYFHFLLRWLPFQDRWWVDEAADDSE